MTTLSEITKRVATYERVSSEDQRERETILTQTEELAARLAHDPSLILVERYADDGYSGTIDMVKRPAGRRMLEDAAAGKFEELWVYKIDRLGRDDVDPLIVWRELDRLGIKLVSATENVASALEYHMRVMIAAEERRNIAQRTRDGMNRAARGGNYTGGIVAYGYRAEGEKPNVKLVPSDDIAWGDLSYADVIRRMYHRVGIEGWSCRRVADEFNGLGIPTTYQRDGRGVRGKRTSGKWTSGDVCNKIKQPIYRGESLYGRRSKAPRDVIAARVEPLVSDQLWHAAQATLKTNQIMTKNCRHTYLLAGRIRCSACGLHYCGSWTRDAVRYRCDGGLIFRGPLAGRCKSKSFYGDGLERTIRSDVERWLRDPGDIIQELVAERHDTAAAASTEAERRTLEAALAKKRGERDRLLDAYQAGAVPLDQLKPRMDDIASGERQIEERLAALEPEEKPVESVSPDLLQEVRRKLDAGLDEEQWREIVSILVREIVIHSEGEKPTKKTARAVVTYNFPDVVSSDTGRGSWRRRA